MTTILDFQIRPINMERCQLEVFERGQEQPLATAAFDYPLSFLTGFELNRLDSDGNDPVGRFERLQNFGHVLYQKLFTADIQRIWQEYKDRSEFLVLCLRIAPEASGLEALPWETLFDGAEFLAAGSKTGLSRLPLDVLPQDALPPAPLPLKMLALVASPLDLKENEHLQIEREQEILLEAVNTPAGQGRLQVDFEDEAKLEILESSLESGYHLFHFIGHGIPLEEGGGLLLEDESGQRRRTAVDEVLHSLQKRKGQLRLAVLSGCQTARTSHVAGFNDLARGLLRGEIPAVIAMQFSISDEGGLRFVEALYPKLVAGQPLELAVSAARHTLRSYALTEGLEYAGS